MSKQGKRILEKNGGITLVALVVTIIILLILAGITISALTGENGLITRAKQAALEQKKAQYFEEINLEIFDEQTERFAQSKEEAFIQSIKTRIEAKKWVSQVLMCKEENAIVEEELKAEDANVLIVEIKDGYEIIIDASNGGLTASIRDSFEKVGKKYKVEYDKNGGTGNEIESQETRQGFSVILPENTYTKAEYKFVGWCENKEGTGEIYLSGSIYTPKQDTKLYAVWSDKTVKISYEANGGTGTMSESIVNEGDTVSLTKNNFIRTGYIFVNWNTNVDGTGKSYNDGDKITVNEDIILYAQWQIITYTINYDANGGTEAPVSQTKNYGIDLILSTTIPERNRYTFLGWATSSSATKSEYSSGESYNKNENVTLYAVWEIDISKFDINELFESKELFESVAEDTTSFPILLENSEFREKMYENYSITQSVLAESTIAQQSIRNCSAYCAILSSSQTRVSSQTNVPDTIVSGKVFLEKVHVVASGSRLCIGIFTDGTSSYSLSGQNEQNGTFDYTINKFMKSINGSKLNCNNNATATYYYLEI